MGHRVGYSRSPLIHRHWLRSSGLRGAYELVDVEPEAFPEFFRNLADRGYVGGNITTPHKDAAFRLVHHRDGPAEAIGAVNTVWYEGDRLVGGNTDFIGLLASLDESAPGWDDRGPAVVIGAGGAARAVVYGLIGRGLDVGVVNRTPEKAQALVGHFGRRITAHPLSEIERQRRRAAPAATSRPAQIRSPTRAAPSTARAPRPPARAPSAAATTRSRAWAKPPSPLRPLRSSTPTRATATAAAPPGSASTSAAATTLPAE